MLHEMGAGDIVAVELGGESRVLRVGRVLGIKGTTKRAFAPTGVVVDRLDPCTLAPIPFDARCEYEMGLLGLDVEVVALVASADFMRGLRRTRARTAGQVAAVAGDAEGDAIDPMRRMHDRANRSALLEWHADGAWEVPF